MARPEMLPPYCDEDEAEADKVFYDSDENFDLGEGLDEDRGDEEEEMGYENSSDNAYFAEGNVCIPNIQEVDPEEEGQKEELGEIQEEEEPDVSSKEVLESDANYPGRKMPRFEESKRAEIAKFKSYHGSNSEMNLNQEAQTNTIADPSSLPDSNSNEDLPRHESERPNFKNSSLQKPNQFVNSDTEEEEIQKPQI